MEFEKINVRKLSELPEDYHCSCSYCKKFKGMLIRKNGDFYNRNERRKYYSPEELASTTQPKGHLAKTPLHVARWAVQRFTSSGDIVVDPTVGAGTTLVEAMHHGCTAYGVELEFPEVTRANIKHAKAQGATGKGKCYKGDARKLRSVLRSVQPGSVQLVVNNPPYSGDQSQKAIGGELYDYQNPSNLGLLKERGEYFSTIQDIYGQCGELLKPRGTLVIGIKDMVRNKAPYPLHEFIAGEVMLTKLFSYVGMWLLPHYPPTLFMNTYNKRFPDVKVPRYQTITVFKRK